MPALLAARTVGCQALLGARHCSCNPMHELFCVSTQSTAGLGNRHTVSYMKAAGAVSCDKKDCAGFQSS